MTAAARAPVPDRITAATPAGAVAVEHLEGDRFRIDVRGHTLLVDQPVGSGGSDSAPTPTELLVASLASCVAFYARRYLVRHDLPTTGLHVDASYELGERPARVSRFVLAVTVPDGVPEDRRAGLLAVASRCTVHNTLHSSPEVSVVLG